MKSAQDGAKVFQHWKMCSYGASILYTHGNAAYLEGKRPPDPNMFMSKLSALVCLY